MPRAELERAQALAEELFEATDVAPGVWRCPACGEACEAAFEACWSCGAERGAEVRIVEPASPPSRA
ncbi:MAG: hypothetical protein H6828_16500 [Planctomycetes bacterium]|nr:hypothetical protein [Planctomycetota bacterium]